MIEIKQGTVIPALGNKATSYIVLSVDEKGFTMARADTASKVRVTNVKIARLLERLNNDRSVLFQGNASKGGVDGTSAIRDALLFAVGAERIGRTVHLKLDVAQRNARKAI